MVLAYLKNHYCITAKHAMDELGIFRLGARIYDLKAQGVPIKSGWMTVKNRRGEDCRVKMYYLTGEPAAEFEKVKS
jgi:hypothetical protein